MTFTQQLTASRQEDTSLETQPEEPLPVSQGTSSKSVFSGIREETFFQYASRRLPASSCKTVSLLQIITQANKKKKGSEDRLPA